MKDKTFVAVCISGVLVVVAVLGTLAFLPPTPTGLAVTAEGGKPTTIGAIVLLGAAASIICYYAWRK